MAIDFLGALGAGSDIDTKSLVESLVAAERAPREASINAKIDKAELQISGYGTVLSATSSLSDAFSALNDADDFKDFSVSVNAALSADGSSAYSVQATPDVAPGITEVTVTSIATNDRWVSSSGYAAKTTALNGGNTFTVDFTVGGVSTTVNITDPTPQGVIDAINDAGLDIEASIVDTGSGSNPFKILLSGQLGVDNAFTVSNTSSLGTLIDFGDHVSTASNAELTINGVDIERDSNTISDAIDGITLTLAAPTAGVSSISVQQDKTGVESRLRALVEAYNSLETTFDILADPDGTDDLAGVFSGSTSFRMIRSNIRSLITNASTTPTDNLTYLSDIGIQFSRTGFLEIDEDRLSTALDENFSEIVTLLSADTNNQSTYDDAARGLAGEALLELDALMASDGTVLTNTNSLEDRVEQYAIELEDLDRRMTKINQRYLMQFTAMETAIDEMNSLREYLDQQLSALPFTNKNNN